MIDRAQAAKSVAAVAGILLLSSFTAAAQQRKLEPEAARLIELLGLSPAASVADIGAGSGEMTVEIARQLGKGSRVFSTDINQDRLREIAAAATAAELSNVTFLEGHPDRTNLPDGCCDAVFVRHVYHHFKSPPQMNASIRRSLKPGGRFAVMDFPPDKPGTGTVPPELRGGGRHARRNPRDRDGGAQSGRVRRSAARTGMAQPSVSRLGTQPEIGSSDAFAMLSLAPVRCPSRNEQRRRRERCMLSSMGSPRISAPFCPLCRGTTLRNTRPSRSGCYRICSGCNHMWHVTGEALRAEKAPLPSRRRTAAAAIPTS